MHIRRHHLIEEAKAELDLTYEEVKRAENRLIALDIEYGKVIEAAREMNGSRMPDKIACLVEERDAKKIQIDVSGLYSLEKAALERFSILTAAFSSVCMHAEDDDAVERVGRNVFRPREFENVPDHVRQAVHDFVHGLRAYTTEAASPENDRVVREAWMTIENTLRDFGRTI